MRRRYPQKPDENIENIEPGQEDNENVETAKPVKGGVKTGNSWRYDLPKRAYKLCLLGLTDKDLGVAFGVTERCINFWLYNKPEFRRAVELGRQEADSNIALALYKRAKGYSHPEVHISVNRGEVTTTEYIKHYPPDTAAAVFWLKNRQQEKWADVWKIEQNLNMKSSDSQYDLTKLSPEELSALEKLGINSINAKIGGDSNLLGLNGHVEKETLSFEQEEE